MKTRSEQVTALENPKNRTETGQRFAEPKVVKKAKLSKTHQDYWLGRLRKRTYRTKNATHAVEIPTWQVRLSHAGKEGWFNLCTVNQAAAAVKARDVYIFLKPMGGTPHWSNLSRNPKPDPRST